VGMDVERDEDYESFCIFHYFLAPTTVASRT
jgi:hypothetical protein